MLCVSSKPWCLQDQTGKTSQMYWEAQWKWATFSYYKLITLDMNNLKVGKNT